jgi:hypothetical protein
MKTPKMVQKYAILHDQGRLVGEPERPSGQAL